MVLQRDASVPVWGWADPGGAVTVSLEKQTARAVADAKGKWSAKLGPLAAGGPYALTVSGKNTITRANVMVGDVWLCSGQSNMEMNLRPGPVAVYNVEEELARANYPNIRLLSIPRATSFEPKDDISGLAWQVCTSENVSAFSAAGYFFGRDLHTHLNVPIGLIDCSRGATPAEAWTSPEALRALPDFRETIDALPELVRKSSGDVAAYEKAAAEWDAALDSHDAGYRDAPAAWANPDLDTNGWTPMSLPTYWEDAGYPNLDGFMWYRKVVDVPKEWAGHPLTLGLGTINDMDRAWFNGVLVGSFEQLSGWTKPREYDVPGELVKAGRNVIAVRVYDIGNKGGLCGIAKDLWLRPAKQPQTPGLPLAGEWRCKVGLDLATIPPKAHAPDFRADNFRLPGVLFNAMVSPLIPYGMRGAIWYQGESNAERAYQYRTLFPCLIQDWRTRWGRGDFPFLYVQLANFLKPNAEPVNDAWAELREAQLNTLSVPNTGMAVTVDIGDADNIHPRNKQEVGRRLALAARHVAYGEGLVYSGPIYRSMGVEGHSVRLQFQHAENGLICKGDRLLGFSIAGADQKFYWADAHIEGNTVRVACDNVPNPVAVRYAWSTNPACNLLNKEGLPASPFRTDNWTGMTEGKR